METTDLVVKEPVKTSLNLDRELMKRVKYLSVDLDKSITEIVEEALEEYLKKHGK